MSPLLTPRRRRPHGALVALVWLAGAEHAHAQSRRLEAGAGTPHSTVTAAIRAARPGDTVVVRAGTYREPTIVVDRSLTLLGAPGAVLDGGASHTVLHIRADFVTVRGLTLRNTGPSQSEARAAIRVDSARGCRVEGNRIERALFGVYLEKATSCQVLDNEIVGPRAAESASGNGIHVWSTDSVVVARNRVSGHRDGIYFEFVNAGRVEDNRSHDNTRYGLHFMFSHQCHYARNAFVANGNGVAVMYSTRVQMVDNIFERNWGGAAYGLLLKDINDSEIAGNRFLQNSVGLHLEGANRNTVHDNVFRENGWALKVLANAEQNVVERNAFERNAFDVGTNSRTSSSTFRNNYWDRYRGYDLNRDGRGDVPHAPVRLFSLLVEQSPPTLILLRSLLVDALDLAERVMPALTPAGLTDPQPWMRPPNAGAPVARP